MGLDNGIIAVRNMRSGEIEQEVCYWRKCWAIRNKILEKIAPNDINEKFEFDLEIDDIDTIIDILKWFCIKENFDNWESFLFWDYKELEPQLEQDIENLKNLKRVLENPSNNVKRVYFYDSY